MTPVILAAGASRRLGRPKALLDFGGRTALAIAIESCRSAGLAPPLIVLGAEAARIEASLGAGEAGRPGGWRIVRHEGWAAGRSSSLKAGLKALDGSETAFMLFPVDRPLALPETIRALVDALRGPSGGPAIALPVFGDRRGHPVACAATLAAEFLRLGDDEPAHLVVRRDPGRVRELIVEDPGVLEDLDTPEDYERALERWRRRESDIARGGGGG